MRILTVNLLAVALLLFGASSASAIAFNISARTATSSLTTSDVVVVDVFADLDVLGIRAFSVGVLSSDASVLQYDGAASAALPVIYPAPSTTYGTTGAEPGYLLYSPGAAGMPPVPFVELLPQQTPTWITWPGTVPPGTQQVNINYAESNITDSYDTRTTGTNIWIASMVFHVASAIGPAGVDLYLCNTCGGNVFGQGDLILDPGTIALSGPVHVTGVGVVPEPTTAVLIGLGLCGLVVSGRRK